MDGGFKRSRMQDACSMIEINDINQFLHFFRFEFSKFLSQKNL